MAENVTSLAGVSYKIHVPNTQQAILFTGIEPQYRNLDVTKTMY